ncbi:MAG TPA: AI-2E family transporter [Vicinamibacterales bacterium]|nr:AI-2E family transporter [Vicinamibacterales bacterium]
MSECHQNELISRVLTWFGLALLVWLVYLVLRPFLIALGWAAVLASVSYPIYERLERGRTPTIAAVLTTCAVTFVVVVPSVVVMTVFVRETLDLASQLQTAIAEGRLDWIDTAWTRLQQRIPAASSIDVQAMSAEGLKQGATYLMAASGSFLQDVATFLIDVVLALFATFFLLRDTDVIMHAVRRLLPMNEDARERLIARTRDLIWAGVVSSAAVAVLQGVFGGIALAVVGIRTPVFWGVVTAFACLLPFGAWVVWLPAAGILAASGDFTRALVLIALGLTVVSGVDNVARPALLSGHAHINGLVIFVSLLGGLSVFGLLGLVLGPIIVVTALGLLDGHVNHRHVRA